MRIRIDTEVLQSEHLSLGEFLVLLMGYKEINYKECLDSLINKGVIQPNLFNRMSVVLSDNNKNYVSKILLDSDPKVMGSALNFETLAAQLQSIYPTGNKPGTSYNWRGKAMEIEQKLKTLVAAHGFDFTESEAIQAAKEYVSSFDGDRGKMQLLKYFILRTDGKNGDISPNFINIQQTGVTGTINMPLVSAA